MTQLTLMSCSECQAPVPAGSRFCPQCGQAQERKCACGATTPPGALFCTDCGKPLDKKPQGTGLLAGATGERRVVTVLFADVSGFTAMSEKLDPEEVSQIMNAFFQVLADQIYKFGGTVDKYIGDCIMALFGAPIAHEDDAERAVSAAWAMQIEGGRFADELESRTGIRLKVRIGLNTGLVVAGAVGGEQKRDYTVLGDTVNLASRLESNARPGHILVSRETQRLARRAWFFESLEPIKVKGKEALIPVFEVQGPRAGLAEGEERPAFTGRTAELAALRQERFRSAEGHPAVVAIVGEAGIGKSRLVREFLREARAEGATVLRGRCLSYQQTTPYSLVGRLLTDGFGFEGADREQLAALCRAHDLAEPRLAAEALAHVLGEPLADPDLANLAPDQLRGFVSRTLVDLLRAEARRGPLILSLNDVHWIDSASADFVTHLIDDLRRNPAPILTLLLYRPEGEDRLEFPEIDYRRLRLGPLSADEGFGIIASFLEVIPEGPAAAFLRDAVAKAEGNPFYLCELIRALTEQEVLVREGETWVLRDQDVASAIPVTIQGAVAARVDRLSVGTRQVVQIGAIFGRAFSRRLVGKLLGNPRLEAELAELLAAELVSTRDGDLHQFSQAIIQEVVYQGLLVRTRKELHKLAGAALEEEAADVRAISPVLALHFLAAEDELKALKYLTIAAERDAERYASKEARDALATALEIRRRLGAAHLVEASSLGFEVPIPAQIELQLAHAEGMLGRFDAALAACESVLGSGESALFPEAHRVRGDLYSKRGDYAAAGAAFAAGLAAGPDAAERARILVQQGIVAFRQGDYDSAIAVSKQAVAELGGGAHPREVGRAANLIGLCQWRTGRFQEAETQLRDALPVREAARDFIGVGDTLFNLANLASSQGRWAIAVATGQKAFALHVKLGDAQRIAQAYCNVGTYAAEAGDLSEAEKALGEAVLRARQVGDRFNEGLALLNLGEVSHKAGRLDEAEGRLREALAILEAIQSKGNVAQALLALGEVLDESPGRSAEAWEALARGLQLAQGASEKMVVGAAYHRIARFYRRAGQLEEALAWAGKGVGLLQETQFNLELGRAYTQLAEILAEQGKDDLAKGARDKAIALFEALGAASEAERAGKVGGVRQPG